MTGVSLISAYVWTRVLTVGKPQYTLKAWPPIEEGGVFGDKCDVKMVWSMAKGFYNLWIGDGDVEDFMSKLEPGLGPPVDGERFLTMRPPILTNH
jgi:hypothetical protein